MNTKIYKCDYFYANTIIKKLGNIAREFYGSNAIDSVINNAILSLARYHHYNSISWTASAGTIDSKLVNYLKEKDSGLFKLLENKIVFTDNKNNEIDFSHFCATLDSYLSGVVVPKEWAGWHGDLATLTIDVARACNGSDDYDLLISKAKQMLGNSNYSFSKEDINSDIDAENIYNYIQKNKISFMTAFENYYYNVMNMSRFNRFITALGDDAYYKIMAGPDPLIYVGLNEFVGIGQGVIPSIIQRKAVSGTFASFVFEKRDSSIT